MQSVSDKVKHLVSLEIDFLINHLIYFSAKQKSCKILYQDGTVRTILNTTIIQEQYFRR